MNGVCYAHAWSRDGDRGYGSAESAASLQELHELGVTWISLTPFGYQGSLGDDRVKMGNTWPGGETDAAVAADVARAHALGMKVLLKPHLWIRGGAWCGHIRPGGGSEQDWQRWFASYRKLVLHYADLAARSKIEAFAVGTELSTAVVGVPVRQWRALLTEVRARYSGELTYAANWDVAERVPFWDALDFVGVQAYEPLSTASAPTAAELAAGARATADRFERLYNRTGKLVVLTEVGFRSARGAAAAPNSWPDHDKRPAPDAYDPDLQAAAYDAMLTELSRRPWFAGAFWWKWFTWRATTEEGPLGFAPKAAAKAVLRHWYARGRDQQR